MVDGLLQGSGLHLHLHRTSQGLSVGVGLGRAQDVLHRARVRDLRGQLGGVEQMGLHEVLVR